MEKERQVKRAKRKGIEGQRVKHPTTSQATDALIGNEEQNDKQKRTKRKTGSGSQTQLPWTIQSPPMMLREHSEPILFKPHPLAPRGGLLKLPKYFSVTLMTQMK